MVSEELIVETVALIERLRAGDERAGDALFRLYEKRLYHWCLTMLRDPQKAEDAAQDTWLMAWRSLNTLRNTRTFPDWLSTIARRQCLAVLEKERRHPTSSLDAGNEEDAQNAPSELADTNPTPEQLAMSRARLEDIERTCKAELSAKQFAVVQKRIVDEKEHEEIGQELGMRVGNTRVVLHNALEKLKKHFQSRSDGADRD